MKDIYYEVQHSGIKTHFGTLGAAKRVAQKWANETGLMLRIFKASHKEYHRTGSSYKGEVAQVHPKAKNPRTSLPIGRLVTVKARRLKNGRVELYRA